MLLVHDGELADVRELLEGIGLAFRDSPTRRVATGDYLAAPVVIATPQYLSNRLNAGEVGSGVRIAIVEDQGKTLLAMLSRGGVEWFVRRPFHPAALRGLILHCLYQGPEKRRAKRVSIGAAVHFQTGWRRRGALLADISERDCRLLSRKSVEVGKRVKLKLPAELAGRRVLHLDGRVVRTAQSPRDDGSHEICVLFDPLATEAAQRLKELLSAHGRGPAVLTGAAARHLARSRPCDPEERGSPRRSVISVGALSSEPAADGEAGAAAACDRRTDPRREYRRRIIALSDEATRVLVARDISRQGMRVDPNASLELGSELRIAIHAPAHDTPLVVSVRVHRDDGERGVVLHFVDLPEPVTRYLDGMLGELPDVSGPGSDGDPRVYMVSEIVA